ncbi:MAG: hypothetical protein LQ349_007201 [Xanthoria aureola]|nr:MAG: hypothetical protein LQ349_007201 [Xanthoria aureola]
MLPPYLTIIPLTLTLTLILPSSARPNTPSHTTLSPSLSPTILPPTTLFPTILPPTTLFPTPLPPTTLFPTPLPPTTHPRTPLRPRANGAINLNNGWSLHYNTLDIILPNIPIAATSLLQFYDLILASLEEEEGDWEPRHRVFASTPEGGGGIKLGLYAAETLITKEWLGAFVRALERGILLMWRSVEETGGGDAECRVDDGQL